MIESAFSFPDNHSLWPVINNERPALLAGGVSSGIVKSSPVMQCARPSFDRCWNQFSLKTFESNLPIHLFLLYYHLLQNSVQPQVLN